MKTVIALILAAAGIQAAGNRFLDLRVDSAAGTLSVTDKRNHHTWVQKTFSKDIAVKAVKQQGDSIQLELADSGNNIEVSATITAAKDKPEIEVALKGQGSIGRGVAFPFPFVTEKETWLIVPLNEGVLYPVGDESIRPFSLITYSGHGICMPWYGATDPATGAGAMTILRTPDDARIEIARQPGTGLFVRPVWEASRGEFSYERKLTYVFFDRGGYVAQAKRYREYAQETGLFKTLAQKRSENPNVDLLIGAVNVWSYGTDKTAITKEMKSLGMDRVLWSNAGSGNEIDEINKAGYLTSRYDQFQDVFPPEAPGRVNHEGWPEDLVLLKNGDWMKGWAIHRTNPDGTKTIIDGGVITSSAQLKRASRQLPEDLMTHAYKCRFIDTTTATPWREDYSPVHPLTRSEDRENKMKLLEFMSKDMKLVVGTETGIDPSVPYVHYYEGMLSLTKYRLPDAGRDMLKYKPPTPDFLKFQVGHFYRIPLWELVYHDCVVAQWYWGDYNNKAPEVWDRRDLFNILYGTPPMFMFDKAIWEKEKQRFVASYRNICPLARKLGYDEMLAHTFLTPDHAVQRTRWKSGAEVVVNFGDAPYKLDDGRTVKTMSWLVNAPRP
jgi:hypothetical protein